MALQFQRVLPGLISLALLSSFVAFHTSENPIHYTGILAPPGKKAQKNTAAAASHGQFGSFVEAPFIEKLLNPPPLNPQPAVPLSNALCADVLPWDAWDRAASEVVTFDFLNQPHRQDGIGNKMFAFAARAIYAVDHQLPMQVKNLDSFAGHRDSGQVSFPCARSSVRLEETSSTLSPAQIPGCDEHAFCQELPALWGSDIAGRKPLLAAAFQSVRSGAASEEPVPGLEDLVIHFRSYDYGRRRRLTGARIQFTGFRTDNFQAAPFRFFKKVIDDHREIHPLGAVWLVLEQKAQAHPIVNRLVSEANAKVFAGCKLSKGNAMCDFRFMMAASTLVLSPSTFSWWAAYLGTGQVHFPVLPGTIGPNFPWCLLVINDSRWVYYLVFESDPLSWRRLRGTAEGAAEVRSQCAVELQKWNNREDISDVHAMFDMPPPVSTRKIVDRSHGRSDNDREHHQAHGHHHGQSLESHDFPRFLATANDTVNTSLAFVNRLKPALLPGVYKRMVAFVRGAFEVAIDRTCSPKQNVCTSHGSDYHSKFAAEEIIPNSILDSPWVRPVATSSNFHGGPRLVLQLTTCRGQGQPANECMAAVHHELRSAGATTNVELAEQLRQTFFIFTFDYGPCGPGRPQNKDGYADVVFQASPLLTQNGHKNTSCYDPAKDIVIPTSNAHRRFAETMRSGGVFDHFGDSLQLLDAAEEGARRLRPQLAYFVTGGRTLEHRERIKILDTHKDSKKMRIVSIEKHGVGIEHMLTSKFCIEADGNQPWSPRLVEYLVLGCVPVLVSNKMVPPFQRTFDWERLAVFMPHTRESIDNLESTLEALVSSGQYAKLRVNVLAAREAFIYEANPRLGALPVILFEMDQVLKTWKGNVTAASLKFESPKSSPRSQSLIAIEHPMLNHKHHTHDHDQGQDHVLNNRMTGPDTRPSHLRMVSPRARPSTAREDTDDVGYTGTAPSIVGVPGHVMGADGVYRSFTDLRSTLLAAIISDEKAANVPPARPPSKLVIISTADLGYRRLAWNWACKLQEVGVRNFVVFAIDHQMAESLRQRKVNSFYARELAKPSDAAVGLWGTASYNSVVHLKTKQQLAVVALGFDAFYLDIDITLRVELRNDLVKLCPDCDILVQQNWPMLEMNPGCTLFRSRPATHTLLLKMLQLEKMWDEENGQPGAKQLQADHSHGDQSAMNHIATCGRPDESHEKKGGVKTAILRHQGLRGLDGVRAFVEARRFTSSCAEWNLTYALLPPVVYQTGNSMYDFGQLRGLAGLIHPNFMSGRSNKENALQKYGLWCNVTTSQR